MSLGYFKLFTLLLFYIICISNNTKMPDLSSLLAKSLLFVKLFLESHDSHFLRNTNSCVITMHGAAVAMAATYFCPSAVREHSLQSGHTDSLRSRHLRSRAHLLFTLLSVSGVLQFISPMAAGIKFPVTLGRSAL